MSEFIEVYHRIEKKAVRRYKNTKANRTRAHRLIDKLDNEYGAYVASLMYVTEQANETGVA